MGISFNREVIHQSLGALGDLKSDVNFRLTIDNIGINLHVFVSLVFVERGNVGHALMEQLVAELASGEQNEAVSLHRDLPAQYILTEMLIAAEIDGLYPVTGSTFDFVDQLDIRSLVLKICGHFHIEVALALEKIDQIPPALFHQVRIDGSFGKYGD